ncbi:MAG: MraY family glycosyltransferase [Ardenticatenaceae bacterium]|nr:MraY family glycosyltransferase [Ardenticatenaceae bacterium]
MSLVIIIFILSLSLTMAGTPFIRRTAMAIGFVDMPAGRKMHREPMPLMGGVAIFGGALVGFLLIFVIFRLYTLTNEVIGILLAITIMALVGLVDDRTGGLRARYKLFGQLLAVVVLIYFGVQVELAFPPLINYGLTIFWILILSNAVNFLDNMDGACAGISGVAAAFILLIAAINGQELVAALAAGILGATLGFLRYNFKPARIFMGDAGSLFLGFLLAILALELNFPQNSNFVTWMVPLLILGVPLFDLTLVIIARLRRGVNPLTTPGKDHLSHRFVRLGFTQREAVLTLYLIGGIFGLVAIFVTQASITEGYVIGSTIAVLVLMFIIWLLRQQEA